MGDFKWFKVAPVFALVGLVTILMDFGLVTAYSVFYGTCLYA